MRHRIVSVRFAALAALFLLAASSCGNAGAPASAPAAPSSLATPAPDFEFASGYGWRHLHDLCATGGVVLVFGADDAALAQLQQQLPRWRAIGVEPMAVVTRTDGDNWAKLERLGLTYALLSDANDAVGARFGMTDVAPSGGSWCLVDERMQIRRRAAGAPNESDLEAMAAVLGGSGTVAAAPETQP